MAMKIDRFTEKAREALGRAQELAQEYNHPQVDAEHLLFALLEQDGGIVPEIITKIGGNPTQLRSQLRVELDRLPKVYGGLEPTVASRMRLAIEDAGSRPNSTRTNTSAPSICCWPWKGCATAWPRAFCAPQAPRPTPRARRSARCAGRSA